MDPINNIMRDTCWRMTIVGSSDSGKTYLFCKMLDEGMLGRFGKIIILARNMKTLHQQLYQDMNRRGKVILQLDNNKNPFSAPSVPKADYSGIWAKSLTALPNRNLLVLDDYDAFPKWTQDLFTVDSHHDSTCVVAISHAVKTGNKKIRGSNDVVILSSSPEPFIDDFLEEVVGRKKVTDEIRKKVNDNIEKIHVGYFYKGNCLFHTKRGPGLADAYFVDLKKKKYEPINFKIKDT